MVPSPLNRRFPTDFYFYWVKYFENASESQHRRSHHNGAPSLLARSVAPQTGLRRRPHRRDRVEQLEELHTDLIGSAARSGITRRTTCPRTADMPALTMLQLAAATTGRLTTT